MTMTVRSQRLTERQTDGRLTRDSIDSLRYVQRRALKTIVSAWMKSNSKMDACICDSFDLL